MCELTDFDSLSMMESYRKITAKELPDWHRIYLPVKGNVVDMGAGCGETAFFFLQHGAEHVIAFEDNLDCLKHLYANFGKDSRVTIIPMRIGYWKSDIDGSENGSVFETHGPVRLRKMEIGTASPRWKIEESPPTRSFKLRVRAEGIAFRRYLTLQRIYRQVVHK